MYKRNIYIYIYIYILNKKAKVNFGSTMQYYMYCRLLSTSRAKTLTLLDVGQFITLSSVLEIFLEIPFSLTHLSLPSQFMKVDGIGLA